MKKLLRILLGGSFDIRKGEWLLTLLMFANYYLILVTYYLLKPARDSLFLVKVRPEELPLVFIITALVTVPVVAFYSRASRSLKLNKLINITIGVVIINLLVLRWLIQRDDPWVYYLFYTWVSIYGALTTSQFWLLSNAIFDAAQAKRIFALLALGGIVGAFTGGQVTSVIVTKFGVSTENLLYLCIGLLALSMVLVSIIWQLKSKHGDEPVVKKRKGGEPAKESFGQVLGTLKRSRHLVLIVLTIAVTMMVASFVDYQFKVTSKESFPDKDSLTAFLGSFYAWLSFASLILQGLFTNRFLRILGVGGVILFLPIGLLIGSIAMFIMPGIVAAVILRGTDGAIKYSVDKTGRELLFLPVPLEVKKRVKVFIDIFVDRWFRGFAGGLLLLCTLVFGLSVQYISLVVLGLIAIWIFVALLMRKEYVNTFRTALERRQIDLSELRLNVDDAQSLNALIASLGSTNERQVVYALKMLDSVEDKGLKWPVKPLLAHDSIEVRLNALKVLQKLGEESDIPDVRKLLNDPDIDVRKEAIHFVCNNSGKDTMEVLKVFLNDSSSEIRHAALGCIVEYGGIQGRDLITNELINSLLSQGGDDNVEGRLEVAKALGAIEPPDSGKYFKQLLGDSSQKVVIQTISSIGRQEVREFVPWLINHLADRELRKHCRAALALFGIRVLGTLNDYLNDEKLPFTMRIHIPRVMAEIPHQDSINFLTHSLKTQSSWLVRDILRALNRLRTNNANLRFDDKEIENALINETRSYYEVLNILQLQDNSDSPECELLRCSLKERLDSNLEKIFRLMGLQYPPIDIFNAYQGIVSRRRALRASAIEFLDNVLRGDVKRYIFPILDEVSRELTVQRGRELFDFGIETKEDGLCNLIEGSNVWLKVCAIFNVPLHKTPRLIKLVEEARNDRDPMVRETADFALSKMKSSDPQSTT